MKKAPRQTLKDREQATREALAQRNAEHVPEIYLLITEAQARELTEGRVPEEVVAMTRWAAEELHKDGDA